MLPIVATGTQAPQSNTAAPRRASSSTHDGSSPTYVHLTPTTCNHHTLSSTIPVHRPCGVRLHQDGSSNNSCAPRCIVLRLIRSLLRNDDCTGLSRSWPRDDTFGYSLRAHASEAPRLAKHLGRESGRKTGEVQQQ